MTLELLSTGYWHARFGANQFIQWPKGRGPEPSDCFGWISERQIEQARRAATKESSSQ